MGVPRVFSRPVPLKPTDPEVKAVKEKLQLFGERWDVQSCSRGSQDVACQTQAAKAFAVLTVFLQQNRNVFMSRPEIRHMASQDVPWHALAVLLASSSAAVQLLVLPPCALFASMMPQLVPLDCVVPLVCLLDSPVTELGSGAAECLVMLLPHWKMSQLWPLCSSNNALERLETALELVLECGTAVLTAQQSRSVSAALVLLQRLTFLSPEAFSMITAGPGMTRWAKLSLRLMSASQAEPAVLLLSINLMSSLSEARYQWQHNILSPTAAIYPLLLAELAHVLETYSLTSAASATSDTTTKQGLRISLGAKPDSVDGVKVALASGRASALTSLPVWRAAAELLTVPLLWTEVKASQTQNQLEQAPLHVQETSKQAHVQATTASKLSIVHSLARQAKSLVQYMRANSLLANRLSSGGAIPGCASGKCKEICTCSREGHSKSNDNHIHLCGSISAVVHLACAMLLPVSLIYGGDATAVQQPQPQLEFDKVLLQLDTLYALTELALLQHSLEISKPQAPGTAGSSRDTWHSFNCSERHISWYLLHILRHHQQQQQPGSKLEKLPKDRSIGTLINNTVGLDLHAESARRVSTLQQATAAVMRLQHKQLTLTSGTQAAGQVLTSSITTTTTVASAALDISTALPTTPPTPTSPGLLSFVSLTSVLHASLKTRVVSDEQLVVTRLLALHLQVNESRLSGIGLTGRSSTWLWRSAAHLLHSLQQMACSNSFKSHVRSGFAQSLVFSHTAPVSPFKDLLVPLYLTLHAVLEALLMTSQHEEAAYNPELQPLCTATGTGMSTPQQSTQKLAVLVEPQLSSLLLWMVRPVHKAPGSCTAAAGEVCGAVAADDLSQQVVHLIAEELQCMSAALLGQRFGVIVGSGCSTLGRSLRRHRLLPQHPLLQQAGHLALIRSLQSPVIGGLGVSSKDSSVHTAESPLDLHSWACAEEGALADVEFILRGGSERASAHAAVIAGTCPALGKRCIEAAAATAAASPTTDTLAKQDADVGANAGTAGLIPPVVSLAASISCAAFSCILDFLYTGTAFVPMVQRSDQTCGLKGGVMTVDTALQKEIGKLARALGLFSLHALVRGLLPSPGAHLPALLPDLHSMLPSVEFHLFSIPTTALQAGASAAGVPGVPLNTSEPGTVVEHSDAAAGQICNAINEASHFSPSHNPHPPLHQLLQGAENWHQAWISSRKLPSHLHVEGQLLPPCCDLLVAVPAAEFWGASPVSKITDSDGTAEQQKQSSDGSRSGDSLGGSSSCTSGDSSSESISSSSNLFGSLAQPVPNLTSPLISVHLPDTVFLPAHRVVLSAQAEYFDVMCSDRWAAGASNSSSVDKQHWLWTQSSHSGDIHSKASRVQVITIPEADDDVTRALLTYLYTGELQLSRQEGVYSCGQAQHASASTRPVQLQPYTTVTDSTDASPTKRVTPFSISQLCCLQLSTKHTHHAASASSTCLGPPLSDSTKPMGDNLQNQLTLGGNICSPDTMCESAHCNHNARNSSGPNPVPFLLGSVTAEVVPELQDSKQSIFTHKSSCTVCREARTGLRLLRLADALLMQQLHERCTSHLVCCVEQLPLCCVLTVLSDAGQLQCDTVAQAACEAALILIGATDIEVHGTLVSALPEWLRLPVNTASALYEAWARKPRPVHIAAWPSEIQSDAAQGYCTSSGRGANTRAQVTSSVGGVDRTAHTILQETTAAQQLYQECSLHTLLQQGDELLCCTAAAVS